MDVRRWTEDVGDSARGFKGGPADCYWGELTDLGRRSALSLGAILRDIYVPLGFLPATFSASTVDLVAFRSTNMPRTIETLHQLVEGLWPHSTRDDGVKVDFQLRGWQDEDLIPGQSCRCALLRPRCQALTFADPPPLPCRMPAPQQAPRS